jgi:hypothetical protein
MGPAGPKGEPGLDGQALIEGGRPGEVLAKRSDDDFDYHWVSIGAPEDTSEQLSAALGRIADLEERLEKLERLLQQN